MQFIASSHLRHPDLKKLIYIVQKCFVVSAICILVGTSMLKIVALFVDDASWTNSDPVLPVFNNRLVLLLAIGLECGVIVALIQRRPMAQKLITIAWLAGIFVAYHGLFVVGENSGCPCLGVGKSRLPLSEAAASLVVKGTLAYMIVGSYMLLILDGFWNRDCAVR